MTKIQFLLSLNEKLSSLPKKELEERLTFYTEMIEDRMEEGLTEEEAVAAVGSVEEIAAQIKDEIPPKEPPAQQKKRAMTGWEITLLVLGFPLWFPLLVTAFSVVISLFATLWSLIVSLWAVFGAVAGCAIGGIAAGAIFAISTNPTAGVALLGAGITCAGISILLFLVCKVATKGAALLTKNSFLSIGKCFARKEASV